MKYVYDRKIKPRIPVSSIVKIMIGLGILLLSYIPVAIFLEIGLDGDLEVIYSLALLFIVLFGAAVVFLFLGIRARVIAKKSVAEKIYGQVLNTNPNNPFFTTTCGVCGTKFDYQKSDFCFHANYPSGYVKCPDCLRPIYHNAITNAYAGDWPSEQK